MSVFYPTVGDLLSINAERSPDEVALIDPEKNISLTWSSWQSQVTRLANSLSGLGIKRGERIGTFLKDAVELPTAFFASSYAGGIFVPMNYRLSPKELSFVANDCSLKILIFDEDGREILERVRGELNVETYVYTGEETLPYARSFKELIEGSSDREMTSPPMEDDIALIMYTSGTTGNPKGVVHIHRGVISNVEAWTRPAKISPSDRCIALGPLYHIGPLLSNFMPAVYIGGSNVIQKDFDPVKTLAWIGDFDVKVMWATPTHLNMITSTTDVKSFDVSNLRVIQYSGAPLSPGLFYRIRDVFGGIDLVNAYGMTELDAVSAIYPEEHDQHLGSVGKALPKTFIRIVEPGKGAPDDAVERGLPGEVIVRSPCIMREYWELPDKTEEAIKGEWYFTGDLGRMDEDGYLYFVEREDDMIISGGENIYPLEIENFLSRHPKVRSVAVVGMPDEKWGEIVTAFVVKASDELTEQELDQYCMQSNELARFKRPKRYVFVDELPTTSSGKVDKKLLRR